MPWTEAIQQPGAAQMGIGRRLMESRPSLALVPDQDFIVPSGADECAGRGTLSSAATREADGSYAMVYVPAGTEVRVNMRSRRGESQSVVVQSAEW